MRLVQEDLSPLHPTAVLIKVHAVSLNYRDANIANGGNPWPVIPNGIPGNDAAGEIIAVGERVSLVNVGDRVAPITDSEYVTARSTGRSWLAANEDGTLATHVVFDEKLVTRLPEHLDWVQASIVPCAGTTAWSALKGAMIGQIVLIQGLFLCCLLRISVNVFQVPVVLPRLPSSLLGHLGSESFLPRPVMRSSL